MVNCCVPGCTNYSAKSTNISYHKIPKDPQLQKAWISRLRRENLPPLKNCYVCSEHFDNECCESDFMEQLIGEKKRKRLKVDAIPSIFTFTSPTAVSSKRRATTENRIERKRQKEVRCNVTVNFHHAANVKFFLFLYQTLENILAPSSSGSFADATHEESDMEISEDELVPSDTRDIGIQCCLENRFMVTTTISTQTNKADIYADTADACIQVDENSTLEKLNILHDHTYATSPVSPVVSPQKSLKGISPQKSCGSYPWSDDEEEKLFSNDEDDDDCIISSQERHSTTDTEPESECYLESCISEAKYLVFWSSLKELFRFCMKCGSTITEISFASTGSMLTVRTSCMNEHDSSWNSQPILSSTPVGNLLLCSSILFTGNTFTKIQNFAACLGLKFLSERVFYRHQDRYLFPVINDAWEKERQTVVEELIDKPIVNLNGDGRCDSPGHNAKYGTYTFMDSDTGKIVSFSVVQVTETTSSNAMEKEGFVRCISSLENGDDVSIDRITTDRHTVITSTMAKDYPHIKHQYDVWHVSKSVVKKLNKKAKLKSCQDLSRWIQSVSNHLWWSAATCNGDVKLLREKWVSVLHHVRNKHSWNDAELFRKCAHPCLTRREVKRKCWLKPGTPAYVALEEVVLQPKLLKDLANLTDFCHTGGLEVYHSMILKYCPKREHFSYKGMVARTQLAAIDNNHNTGRKQAVIQRGERVGEARYRPCFPKMHRRWVVKPVLEKKSYAFLPELQKKVLGMCNGTEDPLEPTAVDLPPNIASEPAPGKQDLIKKHRSRFSR